MNLREYSGSGLFFYRSFPFMEARNKNIPAFSNHSSIDRILFTDVITGMSFVRLY